MDAETKREFDLLWRQGIDLLRTELGRVERKIDVSVDELKKNLDKAASSRRWVIGQFIVVAVGVVSVIAMHWR